MKEGIVRGIVHWYAFIPLYDDAWSTVTLRFTFPCSKEYERLIPCKFGRLCPPPLPLLLLLFPRSLYSIRLLIALSSPFLFSSHENLTMPMDRELKRDLSLPSPPPPPSSLSLFHMETLEREMDLMVKWRRCLLMGSTIHENSSFLSLWPTPALSLSLSLLLFPSTDIEGMDYNSDERWVSFPFLFFLL